MRATRAAKLPLAPVEVAEEVVAEVGAEVGEGGEILAEMGAEQEPVTHSNCSSYPCLHSTRRCDNHFSPQRLPLHLEPREE